METTELKKKNLYFTRKEVLDFKRLCTIHGFKKRKVVTDDEGRVYQLDISLPFTNGSLDKRLSNVARYTNSRRTSIPVNDGKNLIIKVEFKKV